jgi:hypothetical protein
MVTDKKKGLLGGIGNISTTLIAVVAATTLVWNALAKPAIDSQIEKKVASEEISIKNFKEENDSDHEEIKRTLRALELMGYIKMTVKEKEIYERMLQGNNRFMRRR